MSKHRQLAAIMFFPVETAHKPMFDLLGTPSVDKKIIIYESGHLVPRADLIKETLQWFDKYLGGVGIDYISKM